MKKLLLIAVLVVSMWPGKVAAADDVINYNFEVSNTSGNALARLSGWPIFEAKLVVKWNRNGHFEETLVVSNQSIQSEYRLPANESAPLLQILEYYAEGTAYPYVVVLFDNQICNPGPKFSFNYLATEKNGAFASVGVVNTTGVTLTVRISTNTLGERNAMVLTVVGNGRGEYFDIFTDDSGYFLLVDQNSKVCARLTWDNRNLPWEYKVTAPDLPRQRWTFVPIMMR